MYDYNFYRNVLKTWNTKKGKKAITKIVHEYAATCKRFGNGCFFLSCLCCCCCGPCGNACMTQAALGENWCEALKAYKKVPNEKLDAMYKKMMEELLPKIEKKYQEALEQLRKDAEDTTDIKKGLTLVMKGSSYQLARLCIGGDQWFPHFVKSVYSHLRFHKEFEYITLDKQDIELAEMMLPFLYPVMHMEDRSIVGRMDDRVLMYIADRLMERA